MQGLWGELHQTNEFTEAFLVEKCEDPVLAVLWLACVSLVQK